MSQAHLPPGPPQGPDPGAEPPGPSGEPSAGQGAAEGAYGPPLARRLESEEDTARLGEALARAVAPLAARAPFVVHLRGELGAGKTTLARAWLAELGHRGAVRSPSYTLLEPYEGEGWRAWHLDLYRLGGPEELELLGVRDLLAGPGLLLVEWPERGGPAVPPADLEVALSHDGPPGRRRVRLLARSPRGAEALGRLAWAEGEAGG